MRAVVGLGNVGPEYAASRHNVGFWVVERILAQGRWRLQRQPWGDLYRSSDAALLRPTMYMNRSGDAVRGLLAHLSLDPSSLLIVYDEADLPVGALRLRAAGGPGTHRGMGSVLAAAGTEDVPRLRVGIGRPEDERGWVDHVLSPPAAEEAEVLARAADRAAELGGVFLHAGLTAALDRFSREGGRAARII